MTSTESHQIIAVLGLAAASHVGCAEGSSDAACPCSAQTPTCDAGHIETDGSHAQESGPPDASGHDPEPLKCTHADEVPSTVVLLPNGVRIDATEVTNCQYEAWLKSNPSTEGQPTECSWNKSYASIELKCEPSCVRNCENHPRVCVDWCDAFAYCKSVGKRLCGKIGGGPNDPWDFNHVGRDEWYSACVSGPLEGDGSPRNEYPGGVYFKGVCNGDGSNGTVPVGTTLTCQSSVAGYEGVFDLSGNVFEWEDSCDGTDGLLDRCWVRGGSYVNGAESLSCDGVPGSLMARGFGGVAESPKDGRPFGFWEPRLVGIRCCSDAK